MARTQIRAVRWGITKDDGTRVLSAAIRDNTRVIYIPPHRLRIIADKLHDIADETEMENTNGS